MDFPMVKIPKLTFNTNKAYKRKSSPSNIVMRD